MRWTRVLTCGLIVLLVVAAAAPARAGEILFSIRDGRVTLVARNAQLSDILAVWEREGRTKIVARERVQGTVVSLELTNEPESTALATVLRSVTGYIAVKRPVPPGNASIYRCVIINPVPAPLLVLAQAPAAGPTQPPRGFPMGAPQSMVGDSGMFPQAFIPPPDDSDDPGTARLQMPIGARLPGTATPSMPSRPPLDNPAAVDPATRTTQPSLTPGFPGGGTGMPGAAVPAQKPPGSPTTPVQKPPGAPATPGQKPPGRPLGMG